MCPTTITRPGNCSIAAAICAIKPRCCGSTSTPPEANIAALLRRTRVCPSACSSTRNNPARSCAESCCLSRTGGGTGAASGGVAGAMPHWAACALIGADRLFNRACNHTNATTTTLNPSNAAAHTGR